MMARKEGGKEGRREGGKEGRREGGRREEDGIPIVYG